jgi:hypothetical protein
MAGCRRRSGGGGSGEVNGGTRRRQMGGPGRGRSVSKRADDVKGLFDEPLRLAKAHHEWSQPWSRLSIKLRAHPYQLAECRSESACGVVEGIVVFQAATPFPRPHRAPCLPRSG